MWSINQWCGLSNITIFVLWGWLEPNFELSTLQDQVTFFSALDILAFAQIPSLFNSSGGSNILLLYSKSKHPAKCYSASAKILLSFHTQQWVTSLFWKDNRDSSDWSIYHVGLHDHLTLILKQIYFPGRSVYQWLPFWLQPCIPKQLFLWTQSTCLVYATEQSHLSLSLTEARKKGGKRMIQMCCSNILT